MEARADRDETVQDVEARADEALDRFLPHDPPGVVARTHTVTAFVVAHDGAAWLARTLAGLAEQERPADVVVGVDVASADGSAELLGSALGGVVSLDEPGLAGAVAAGVEAASASGTTAAPAAGGVEPDPTVAWYWIVHDDSAPQPACLSELLRGADRNPAAAVLVPKTVAWSDAGRLVGVGNRWAPGTPVVDPLDPTERDQGQYDVERAIYAGDSAGMLVRADLWHRLGGMDPNVGDWAAPADLCRRSWGSGAEVVFIPSAVLAHRQAGHRGVRAAAGGEDTRAHPRAHPRRSARAGQLILELSQAPLLALPWRYLRAVLSSAIRVAAVLLTREPEEASAEVAGAWHVLGHPRGIHRARKNLRRPPVTDLRRPPDVRARRGAALGHALDGWAAGSRQPSVRRWWPPPAWIWRPLAVAGALGVAAFLREPGQLFGTGTLRGGGLLPAPGAVDLLTGYLDGWHQVRFGTSVPMPAHLPLLAAASVITLGSVDTLLRLAFGLAVPLAFLSCYASLGQHAVGRNRIPMALCWALLPAGVAAMGGGRISTLGVLLLGPPTARLVIRALGPPDAVSGGVRPAIAAGTMLGVVVAFAPAVYVAAALGALLGWLGFLPMPWSGQGLGRLPGRRALVILGVAGLFLVLWLPGIGGSPWLAVSELGVNDPMLGTPAPVVWGLSPGGPNAVAWAGLPLLLVALVTVAVVRFEVRSLAVLASAVGLLTAGAWLDPIARTLWPELGMGMLWPGVFLMIAAGLLALLVARITARPGLTGELVSVAWLLCIGVLLIAWWVASPGLSVTTATGTPPVVSLDADTSARPRSLVLERLEGQLRYAVAGAPAVRLGDAEALAASGLDRGFGDVVAGLVSGASGEVEQELGGRAIRFVVFDGPPEDPVVTELDATIGLRQLARAPQQSLWLVAGDPARAELVDPQARAGDGDSEVEPVEVPVLTTPTTIDVVLHPLTPLPRELVVAEQADPGWKGSLDGRTLELVTDSRGMLWAPVTTTGSLTVTHRSWRPIAAVAQLVVLVGLMVLSLPKRRAVDPDVEGTGAGGGAAGSELAHSAAEGSPGTLGTPTTPNGAGGAG